MEILHSLNSASGSICSDLESCDVYSEIMTASEPASIEDDPDMYFYLNEFIFLKSHEKYTKNSIY